MEDLQKRNLILDASAKLRKSTSYRRGDPLRSPDLREAAEGLPYTECGLTQASTSYSIKARIVSFRAFSGFQRLSVPIRALPCSKI